MTTENERELAQLERLESSENQSPDLALVLIEVAGRDHLGRVNQFRGMREVTPEEVVAFWREKGGPHAGA